MLIILQNQKDGNKKKNYKESQNPEKSESESHSVVSYFLRPPWIIQSMEFSRPEYWSG